MQRWDREEQLQGKSQVTKTSQIPHKPFHITMLHHTENLQFAKKSMKIVLEARLLMEVGKTFKFYH